MRARARFCWILCLGLFLWLFLVLPVRTRPASGTDNDVDATAPKFSLEAASIFGKRCTACHTYGRGIKVGPDLKGVNDRRKRDWLLKFIHTSSQVIQSGDPTATRLFAEFKQQRMPDWTDLSDKQITDILDYIAIGGPDIKPADERHAELATASDIEHGRQLFFGDARLKNGSQACGTCHSIQGNGMRGGTLGSDLTNVYLRHQDRALTEFLRQPCFQWDAGAAGAYLTTKESFALKAFLRQSALQHTNQQGPAGGSR